MYRTLSPYLRERFGCKVYKLALSTGCSCPNRDGTLGTRGCIFCSGSGEFAASSSASIPEQLEQAKFILGKKGQNARYIAYFQEFTNTYAPASRLRPLFFAAIEPSDIVALSIATRPDCLPDGILTLIRELAAVKPVWVELGLQTIHDETARYIRRGYSLSVYDEAVKKLHAAGAAVVTHMILGLPGETHAQTVQTARYIGSSGADGIKLHLLYVLRGTDLAADYAAGKFHTLTLEEYLPLLADCIRVLPPDMVIHRLTGDGAKRDLIAPAWSADKKRVLNAINRYFAENRVEQGEAFAP